MKREQLVAAARWFDELELQRDAALARKWAALGQEFQASDDGAGEAYQDRAAELDDELLSSLRARLAQAKQLVEDRAEKMQSRETWPAGGSWFSRAYALAKLLGRLADPLAVEAELAQLRLTRNR